MNLESFLEAVDSGTASVVGRRESAERRIEKGARRRMAWGAEMLSLSLLV